MNASQSQDEVTTPPAMTSIVGGLLRYFGKVTFAVGLGLSLLLLAGHLLESREMKVTESLLDRGVRTKAVITGQRPRGRFTVPHVILTSDSPEIEPPLELAIAVPIHDDSRLWRSKYLAGNRKEVVYLPDDPEVARFTDRLSAARIHSGILSWRSAGFCGTLVIVGIACMWFGHWTGKR